VKWYIVQTRSRWEKKVADCLEQMGIESYCPVKKVKRKWSDRIKTLEEPFVRSCVFVKMGAHQKTDVRLVEGVVNFIYENGKPVQVRERDIQLMKKGLTVDDASLMPEESGKTRQRKAFERYLDYLNEWLRACMERPKLITTNNI
jgi:transcription antitermination factor NusG